MVRDIGVLAGTVKELFVFRGVGALAWEVGGPSLRGQEVYALAWDRTDGGTPRTGALHGSPDRGEHRAALAEHLPPVLSLRAVDLG